MRNLIDLHVHSTASDGTLTPEQVVKHAYEKNLKAIALTDHDTVSGIAQALEAVEALKARPDYEEFELIPGIEISCNYEKKELHILGYFVDYKNEEFNQQLEEIRCKRVKRNEDMIALFAQKGMPVTMEELNEGNPEAVVTRAHFARVMVEKGYVKSKAQAFERYLDQGKPLYLPKPVITPKQALDMLHLSKAVPVLAHPYLYQLGDKALETCVEQLKELGLKGIEAYHSSSNRYETDKLREMAKRQGLFVTGGSDFHGTNKPDIEIGCGRGGLRVHESLLEEVRKCKKCFS